MQGRLHTWICAIAFGIPALSFADTLLPIPDLELSLTGQVSVLARDAQVDATVATFPGDASVLAHQSDDSLIVAGRFTSANGLPRRGLLRMRPDGSVDPDWNPAPDGEVLAVLVDPADDVYVAGRFGSIGGQPRARLAKLDGATGVAIPTWNADVDDTVIALARDPEGRLLVGGQFTRVRGIEIAHLARLDPDDGSVDTAWRAALDGAVNAIFADAGAVFVSGSFSSADGFERMGLVRLSTSDARSDPSWNPAPFGGVPLGLVPGPANTLYVFGNYLAIGAPMHRKLARVDRTTGLVDPGWNPNPQDTTIGGVDRIEALAVGADGAVFVGGGFTSIGGQPRTFLAKLSAQDGSAFPDWAPIPSDRVWVLAARGNRIVMGGRFQLVNGQARDGLAAVEDVALRIFASGFE
jgi:hypothetical protein